VDIKLFADKLNSHIDKDCNVAESGSFSRREGMIVTVDQKDWPLRAFRELTPLQR